MKGFDRIARHYDWLARVAFGKAMSKCQTVFLSAIPQSSRILVLGGGSGWWVSDLLIRNPSCHILYVEPSAEMLKLCKARLKHGEDQIRFVCGTEDAIDEIDFDVVITFFVLDLFSSSELKKFLDRVSMSLRPGSIWLISDFVNRKWWHSILLFIMYRFFRLVSGVRNLRLSSWETFCDQKGLIELSRKSYFGNFIQSVVYRDGRSSQTPYHPPQLQS